MNLMTRVPRNEPDVARACVMKLLMRTRAMNPATGPAGRRPCIVKQGGDHG